MQAPDDGIDHPSPLAALLAADPALCGDLAVLAASLESLIADTADGAIASRLFVYGGVRYELGLQRADA